MKTTQGAEESNSTEISVKVTVSMHRRSILLFKARYVTSVLVMRSCYTCKTCIGYKARENMYLVQCAGKVSSTKRGKKVSAAKCGKHIRCKARENMFQVQSAGKHVSGTKRGKTCFGCKVRENMFKFQSTGSMYQVKSTENMHHVESAGNMHHVQSAGNMHQLQNAGNMHQLQSAGNMHRVQSAGNMHQVQSTVVWFDTQNSKRNM